MLERVSVPRAIPPPPRAGPVGVIGVDATMMHANASQRATRGYAQIAGEMLADADAVDRDEDRNTGSGAAMSCQPNCRPRRGRRGRLHEAKRRLDEQRAEEARPVPRSPPARLREAKRRLEEELDVECRANAAYDVYRARGE
jgi:hypothetical protein